MLTRAALLAAEHGWIPDPLVQVGIRRLLRHRLEALGLGPSVDESVAALVTRMDGSPIALAVDAANHQHYEVPPAFFQHVLGPRLKYSCALWPSELTTLAEAEDAMLALTCERAGIAAGQRVLELGCGWGSLSLWLAERQPTCEILAVSNSHAQRKFVERRARARGLSNLRVVTADMNDFEPSAPVDRIVSVEMFEHMRNYRELLRRMAGWLVPTGSAFIHVFCHRQVPYFFEAQDDSDWMASEFFTGGMMPSFALVPRFGESLRVDQSWAVNGLHYAKTLRAWLARLDAARPELLEVLGAVGGQSPERWLQRWRLFLLACAELFAYRGGEEWFVAHYRLVPAGMGRPGTEPVAGVRP